MARALEIDRLRVAYGATVACRDASLDIEEGEVVALLGRNGAGKSSLVRCALGLRKPDGGSAKLFGLDAWTRRARLMERVGVVPEEPDVPPGLTAAHVVSALALIHRRFDRSAVLRALDRFEVPRRRAFGRLSKGQKSLAQLAFSSGHAPDLLVLDDLFLARAIPDDAGALLQTLIHQRYKLRRSVIVTSNRVVQDWGTYLGDNTMSTTILDRLMHYCHLLEFDGRSYRLKEAAEALARETMSN